MVIRQGELIWKNMLRMGWNYQPVIVSGTGDVPFPLRHYWSVLYTGFQPYQMWYGAK
jgi:hypothetical protein